MTKPAESVANTADLLENFARSMRVSLSANADRRVTNASHICQMP
jgi:hypothetical protein